MSTDFYIWLFVAVIGLISLIVWLFLNKKKERNAESVINSVLIKYQRDELKGFIIPDGIGGLIEIEHLVLLDKGLLLIEHYPISGNLYGAEKIDLWTQVLDLRSYKFANPLRHIRVSRQAIKSLAPDVPIFCRVIFTADSVFPKGKPDEVSVLESLDNDLLFIKEQPNVTNKAKAGWDKIRRIARKDGQAVYRGQTIDAD